MRYGVFPVRERKDDGGVVRVNRDEVLWYLSRGDSLYFKEIPILSEEEFLRQYRTIPFIDVSPAFAAYTILNTKEEIVGAISWNHNALRRQSLGLLESFFELGTINIIVKQDAYALDNLLKFQVDYFAPELHIKNTKEDLREFKLLYQEMKKEHRQIVEKYFVKLYEAMVESKMEPKGNTTSVSSVWGFYLFMLLNVFERDLTQNQLDLSKLITKEEKLIFLRHFILNLAKNSTYAPLTVDSERVLTQVLSQPHFSSLIFKHGMKELIQYAKVDEAIKNNPEEFC